MLTHKTNDFVFTKQYMRGAVVIFKTNDVCCNISTVADLQLFVLYLPEMSQ
jgi:hypothetical protein